MNRSLAIVFDAPARSLGPRRRTAVPGAAPTLSWAVAFGRVTSWITQTECGARRVTVMTGSEDAALERLHQRVVASFRCRPDPAEERRIDDVPVVFALGPGWFLVSKDPEVLNLTNRRTLVSARPLTRASQQDDLIGMLKASGGMPGIEIGDRVGDYWRIDAAFDGERHRGWLTLRPCAGTSLVLLLMSLDAPGDDGRRWLAHGRCRKPTEQPQTWPVLPGTGAAK